MILAFTGHRPNKLTDYVSTKLMRGWLKILKPTTCITGMALGFDQIAAQACIDLEIPFIAAVPCLEQEKLWPFADQKGYHWFLKQAERVEIVSSEPYRPELMQTRNRWMVDRCELLFACWDGSDGGTANCIHYAERICRPIFRIHPTPSLGWSVL